MKKYFLVVFIIFFIAPITAFANTINIDVENKDITITKSNDKIEILVNSTSQIIQNINTKIILTGNANRNNKLIINSDDQGINLVFDNLKYEDILTDNTNPVVKINSGTVNVELDGNSIIQANQDGYGFGISLLNHSKLYLNDNNNDGILKVHGASNYYIGSAAVSGGNIIINNGDINFIGGNKIVGNYGNAVDGDSFTINNGTFTATHGVIDSKQLTTIISDNVIVNGGILNIIQYITVNKQIINGQIKTSKVIALPGENVQLSVIGNKGYKLKNLLLNDNILTTDNFEMPIGNAHIDGTFETINYFFVEGKDSVYNNQDLIFKLDGPHDILTKIIIDGEKLASNNYFIDGPDTVLTLKNDYLSKLKNGIYTLEVNYANGSKDTTTFIIKNEENPKTYDGIIIYVALGLISLITLINSGLYFKKINKLNFID